MATKEEMMAKYEAQLKKAGEKKVDAALMAKAFDACGPANYAADGMYVAFSDKAERERVFTNFVADELKLTDEKKGMKAIDAVGAKLKEKGVLRKYRAVVYYLLAKKLK